MDATLPNELRTLQELVSTLQGALSAAQIENKLLRQKLELFLKRYFGGTKNEGLDPKQMELLLAGLAAMIPTAPAAEKPAPARSTAPAKAVRQSLPTHLETERVVLEPVEVQQHPEGGRMLGDEVSVELDWKPAQFIKRLYIRPKYAKADRIVIAPLPTRLIEKGLPGAGLLTQVIVGITGICRCTGRRDLSPAPRGDATAANAVRHKIGRGGGSGWDRSGNESWIAGVPLSSGRRNADSLSGSGRQRQKPAGLAVDTVIRNPMWCLNGISAGPGRGRAGPGFGGSSNRRVRSV